MQTEQTTRTDRSTLLVCRTPFRWMAGVLCVLAILASVGFVVGGLQDDPEVLLVLLLLLPTAWLCGKLALRGTLEVAKTTTVETTTHASPRGEDS